jgi:hypothetical protein
MLNHFQENESNQSDQSCEVCVHAVQNAEDQQSIICIPHLKTMPRKNTAVCEFHSIRKQHK